MSLLPEKRILWWLMAVSFLLNLVWELVQSPLYEGHISFWLCFLASFGDVAIILFLSAAMAVVTKNRLWFFSMRPGDIATLMLMGGLTAAVLEKIALTAGFWSYGPAMPVVPIIGVGLTPFLQMIILPVLIFYIVKFFIKFRVFTNS